jgi:hypothetical protein
VPTGGDFIGSLPVMILVARLMITLESPSIIRRVRLWSIAIWIPLIRPQISTELFVSYPRFSAIRNWIWPVLSRITAP